MERGLSSVIKLKEEDKWSFDKCFLTEVISKGKMQLESKTLSRIERQTIRIDIETFERFLNGNYEMTEMNSYKRSFPKSIDKLKDYILTRMIKQYKILGESLIRWIISLEESKIFEESIISFYKTTELSFDEQVELTIKNYERNSSKFLVSAKEIILDTSIKQIQITNDCSSYCYHDSITGESYIIINPTETACIFNHEVEHAIEDLFGYQTNNFYCELGPIFYEMLFNEELYKCRGYLESKDYDFRLDETAYLLEILSDYFKILLSFSEKNFNVSTDEFLNTFISIKKVNPINLDGYLREAIANDEIVDDMNYLFSFLKAIELREA